MMTQKRRFKRPKKVTQQTERAAVRNAKPVQDDQMAAATEVVQGDPVKVTPGNTPQQRRKNKGKKKRVIRRVLAKPTPESDVARLADTVHEDLVTKAVGDIRSILHDTVYRGMVKVGEHLLDVFYGGSTEQVRSHSPSKHASLRGLVDQCGTHELPISRSWLNNALNIAIQMRMLKENSTATDYEWLSPSHRVALLPLGAECDEIEKLSAKARNKEWGVIRLKEEVAKRRAAKGLRRAPAPFVLKSLNGTIRLWKKRTEEEKSAPSQLVQQLSEDQLDDAVDLLDKLEKELGMFRDALKKRIG